jgi:hypothetical protein
VIALCVGLCLTFPETTALGQDDGKVETAKKKRKKPKRAKKAARASSKAPREESDTQTNAPAIETRETPERDKRGGKKRERASKDDSAARAAAQAAAEADVIKEGDTNVKVMKFGGLSLEGRLKSPQLLYFVNRVHAEFDRPKLPHRSFMPELDRSTRKDPL